MLKAKDVYLDTIESESLPIMLKWINDRDTVLFNSYFKPVSKDEHKLWFEKIKCANDMNFFGIYKNEEGQLIGSCKLFNINFIDRNAELQIRIGDVNNRCKGYGSQALELLVSFGFDDLNLNKIFLHVFRDNERAIKSYRRVGFIEEGILRRHAHIDGYYKDVLVMGLLREDYAK